jgi:hypothetical protein
VYTCCCYPHFNQRFLGCIGPHLWPLPLGHEWRWYLLRPICRLRFAKRCLLLCRRARLVPDAMQCDRHQALRKPDRIWVNASHMHRSEHLGSSECQLHGTAEWWVLAISMTLECSLSIPSRFSVIIAGEANACIDFPCDWNSGGCIDIIGGANAKSGRICLPCRMSSSNSTFETSALNSSAHPCSQVLVSLAMATPVSTCISRPWRMKPLID